jgi:hypothetical protein
MARHAIWRVCRSLFAMLSALTAIGSDAVGPTLKNINASLTKE